VKFLLAENADVNAKDNRGETPLHLAAAIPGNTEVVELLLADKADVKAQDNDGLTPLRRAIRLRNTDVAELLLANHADVDAKDNSGQTPLHGAAQHGVPTISLGIEIGLPDGSSFYVPAVGPGEMLGVISVSNQRFAGVRIIPGMGTDSVAMSVSALSITGKKLLEATCQEIRAWPGEDAGSYQGKEGETLPLSGLARFDLPVLKVKVVPAHGPPPGPRGDGGSLAYCECQSWLSPGKCSDEKGPTPCFFLSFPEAGKCVEFSGCGQCCRMISPPLASIETRASPKLVSPPDQADFAIFHPTTFRWEPSPNAVSYLLEWDNYPNAVEATMLFKVRGTEFKYETVGLLNQGFRPDQPGRWRICSVDATGTRGLPSEWRTLHYLTPSTPTDSELTPPKLVSPPDGAVFNVYPRRTTLKWEPSLGADSYIVETDYSYEGVWAAEEHKNPRGFLVQGTQFSFDFVGAQPGRWRVWAVNAKDQRGTPSEWRTFRYLR
jgi:Ankyrin repeats (3 copies)